MIKKILPGLIGLLLIVSVIVFASATFIVDETEQVVITRFGKPVDDPVKEPGIHFKKPFIEEVVRFEKRIMEWDGDSTQIPTKEKRNIWVDSTARWKISDPLLFLKRVGTERAAHSQLDAILNSSTNAVISTLNLIESIRSTNRKFDITGDIIQTEYDMKEYTIEIGRRKIGEMIKEQVYESIEKLGIELVDIRLRRINYVEGVREKVYERMISERKRIAARFRSEGEGKRLNIDGERERKLKTIESGAYKQAEEIRGEADAQAAKIYADAYNADPEFYMFLKTMETYQTTIRDGVDLILTTDSDYFKYLKSIVGKK